MFYNLLTNYQKNLQLYFSEMVVQSIKLVVPIMVHTGTSFLGN